MRLETWPSRVVMRSCAAAYLTLRLSSSLTAAGPKEGRPELAGGVGAGFLLGADPVTEPPPTGSLALTGEMTSGRDDDDVFPPPDSRLEVLVVDEMDGRDRWMALVVVVVVVVAVGAVALLLVLLL